MFGNPFKNAKRVHLTCDSKGNESLVRVDDKFLRNGAKQTIMTYYPNNRRNMKKAEKIFGKGNITVMGLSQKKYK